MTPKFLTPLRVEEVDEDAGTWRLLAPLSYDSAVLGRNVTVPVDFITDFASVPRLPIVYLTEGGKGNKAAVVHDWLYTSQAVDRATADAVLREALCASGSHALTASLFYFAVRAFGGSHWVGPNVPQTGDVAAALTTEAIVARRAGG